MDAADADGFVEIPLPTYGSGDIRAIKEMENDETLKGNEAGGTTQKERNGSQNILLCTKCVKCLIKTVL